LLLHISVLDGFALSKGAYYVKRKFGGHMTVHSEVLRVPYLTPIPVGVRDVMHRVCHAVIVQRYSRLFVHTLAPHLVRQG
jgi:hypothetical protein